MTVADRTEDVERSELRLEEAVTWRRKMACVRLKATLRLHTIDSFQLSEGIEKPNNVPGVCRLDDVNVKGVYGNTLQYGSDSAHENKVYLVAGQNFED